MFSVKTNVCNESGAMRAAVRNALRAEVDGIDLIIQGEVIHLQKMEGGEYFAPIAIGEDDKLVNAKVELVLTVADYQAPKPRVAKPKEKEPIVIEKIAE